MQYLHSHYVSDRGPYLHKIPWINGNGSDGLGVVVQSVDDLPGTETNHFYMTSTSNE